MPSIEVCFNILGVHVNDYVIVGSRASVVAYSTFGMPSIEVCFKNVRMFISVIFRIFRDDFDCFVVFVNSIFVITEITDDISLGNMCFETFRVVINGFFNVDESPFNIA